MKSHDFRTLLRRTIAVPILALAVLAVLLVLQISYMVRTLQWVDHTDRVISSARDLTRLMLEMESGMRGYLLTGYTTFLAPYEAAEQQVDPTFTQLRNLTLDNAEQVQRVDQMHGDFGRWHTYSRQLIAIRQKSQGWEDPKLNLHSRRLMHDVRRVREEFIRNEERLRDERAARARRAAILTFVVSALTSIIVAFVISMYTRRQILSLNRSYDEAMQAELKALQDLRKTEQRLATTLRSIGEGVITTDATGRIDFLNTVAEEITGYQLKEVRGRDVTEILRIVDDRTHEPVRDVVKEIGERGSVLDFGNHSLLVTRSGAEFPIEHSGAPIMETNGVSAGLVFVFRDVSQRRRTEEALRSSEKLALIGRLSATIAHEIRNPLDAVSNVLYLLKSSPGATEQVRENIAMGEQEVMRMGQIAGQLLNYSRESRSPISVSIPEILQGTVALFTPKIRAQQIEIGTDFRSRLLVQAIPGELRQIFSNILGNAIEAVGRNGHICIRTRDTVDRHSGRSGVKIIICDDGPGIDPSIQSRLFTPFFSTKGEQGTGLGLWLSRSLVEKHDGTIDFRSSTRPHKHGTVFALFVPQSGESRSPGEPRVN